MGTNEEKQKVLNLSYGTKIRLGKTTLFRLIQKNSNDKIVLDLDAKTDATNFNNPVVIIDPHLEGYDKFNDSK
jgi:hypothetical protein